MFILRSVAESDLRDLHRLSEMVLFINLPPDADIIESKIASSLKAFNSQNKAKIARLRHHGWSRPWFWVENCGEESVCD